MWLNLECPCLRAVEAVAWKEEWGWIMVYIFSYASTVSRIKIENKRLWSFHIPGVLNFSKTDFLEELFPRECVKLLLRSSEMYNPSFLCFFFYFSCFIHLISLVLQLMSNRDDPNSNHKSQLRVTDDTLPSVARSLRDSTNGMYN